MLDNMLDNIHNLFLQLLRFTHNQRVPVFSLYWWDFQFPDEEMEWCDIKQLMNLFN